jgi:sugar phosphate isomerase/epimerase
VKTLIIRSMWDFPSDTLETFLKRVHKGGFDGTDIYLQTVKEPPEVIRELHEREGLKLFGMITTDGKTAADHIVSLERGFDLAARIRPAHLNCHTGKTRQPVADLWEVTLWMKDLRRAL